MKTFVEVRADTSSHLQQFLKELIAFEHQKSYNVELDAFSLSVSKRFDQRMDQYEQKVHKNESTKAWIQGALTVTACLSVFLVWAKVRALKRKFLL
jgi:hypothetical protein